ncbi:hypothetical protein B0T11DRAFT_298516 [Plectosphaerella cucumerina]|uniref:Uncharacterized protein n=1 Tax=Plectosphaerella cucumerina TaxID=40658 RepID=A0A8K0X3Z3_9PEZI|nr:hypothetical protein B0T11DRAFT_298516 [Plectosphaerella cucumerina]
MSTLLLYGRLRRVPIPSLMLLRGYTVSLGSLNLFCKARNLLKYGYLNATFWSISIFPYFLPDKSLHFSAPGDLNEDVALSWNRASILRPQFTKVWDCISTAQTRTSAGGRIEGAHYITTPGNYGTSMCSCEKKQPPTPISVQRQAAHLTEHRVSASFDSLQNIHTLPRDSQAVMDLVFDTAREKLESTGHHGPASALKSIQLEAGAKLRTVKYVVDDLVKRLSSYAETRTAHNHRDQASSIKRLTALASVSFPVSLASGILSMGRRGVDLDLIWFDFFGVSLLLIAIAGAIYHIMRISHLLLTKWGVSVAFSYQAAVRRRQVTTMELYDSVTGLAAFQLWKISSSGLVSTLCKLVVPIPFTLLFSGGMFGNLDRSLKALRVNVSAAASHRHSLLRPELNRSSENAGPPVFAQSDTRRTSSAPARK